MNIDYLFNHPQKIWFDASIMFIALIIEVVGIFLMYRRLDEMEDRLNKCSLVTSNKRFWGDSIRGRMIRLCAVTSAVPCRGGT